nr:retrovirus-related Pol polyprotein from transposon TNT 1-94 [Tanacetum cinerariifolium]
MFRINPFKPSREEKHVPNNVRASVRTKPITFSQPPVFTKKDLNCDTNGLSSTGIDNTKPRRPQPRSNTKNDRVPSASTSSCNKNKGVKVEKHHRNLLLSKNKKHMSSACNNIKLDSQNVISKVVCAMCKQCLISVNHDFMGTVRFENDHVAAIMGFGDLQWENILITRVYFVEALGHNLFSVGQFCDSDLEVAFRRNACFVRNLEGVDLLKGNHSTNLYTVNLHDMAFASPICLMARASSTKSWLWHQRLSHLNFATINDLAKNDLVSGLSKFKYHKEHLCPSCEQGKSKRASRPPKPVPNSRQRLYLLHMDLCGPMRIASINGKRYVLVIVDNYSRYMWVHFLRSKDEAPEVIKNFLKRIIVLLQNQTLVEAARTMLIFSHAPLFLWAEAIATACFTQNRSIIHRYHVVSRANVWTNENCQYKWKAIRFGDCGRLLSLHVEVARTRLIFSRAPLILWAEAIATACFTQNRSIIHRRFNKTPYELINGKKPDISFLHVFGALCYPKNDREDIGKLGAKGDIGFFIGYSADSCAYRVFNRRTKKIMEIMNVSFDELSAMAFEQRSLKPGLQSMTSGHISSGLDLTYAPSTITTQQPSEGELDLLFEAMYDDYIGGQPSATARTVPPAQEPQDVDELNPNAMVDGNTFVNPFANP